MKKAIIFITLFLISLFLINPELMTEPRKLIVKILENKDASSSTLIFALVLFYSASLFYWFSEWIRDMKEGKKVEIETEFISRDNIVQKIKKTDPDFDSLQFLKNVASLAEKLNTAWTKNKMETVRNLISSGVYNRFKIQLELMKLDSTINIMKNWVMSSIELFDLDLDEDYQTVHVQIFAYAKDANVSLETTEAERENLLNEAPQGSYTEVWSFVRKKQSKTFKGKSLLEGNCPNCGAPVEALGESNQCGSCKTIINSGEYDWVLAEITQIEEWDSTSSGNELLSALRKLNPLISRQIIEDRASYLFWRWIESNAKSKKELIHRDATQDFNESNSITETDLREVAVGSVDLHEVFVEDDGFTASVFINWSSNFNHRESIFNLHLMKNSNKKSGLSENSCNNCGAPYPDSDAHACEYCNHPIPKVVDDWILSEVKEV